MEMKNVPVSSEEVERLERVLAEAQAEFGEDDKVLVFVLRDLPNGDKELLYRSNVCSHQTRAICEIFLAQNGEAVN